MNEIKSIRFLGDCRWISVELATLRQCGHIGGFDRREGKADYPSRPLPCRRPCRFLLWRPAQDPNFFLSGIEKDTIHSAIIICRANFVSVSWFAEGRKSCSRVLFPRWNCVCVCAQFVCLCHSKGVLIFGVCVSESVRAQCVCVADAVYH